jgi:hypothetical protein
MVQLLSVPPGWMIRAKPSLLLAETPDDSGLRPLEPKSAACLPAFGPVVASAGVIDSCGRFVFPPLTVQRVGPSVRSALPAMEIPSPARRIPRMKAIASRTGLHERVARACPGAPGRRRKRDRPTWRRASADRNRPGFRRGGVKDSSACELRSNRSGVGPSAAAGRFRFAGGTPERMRRCVDSQEADPFSGVARPRLHRHRRLRRFRPTQAPHQRRINPEKRSTDCSIRAREHHSSVWCASFASPGPRITAGGPP